VTEDNNSGQRPQRGARTQPETPAWHLERAEFWAAEIVRRRESLSAAEQAWACHLREANVGELTEARARELAAGDRHYVARPDMIRWANKGGHSRA
jgi:hypothetical protein